MWLILIWHLATWYPLHREEDTLTFVSLNKRTYSYLRILKFSDVWREMWLLSIFVLDAHILCFLIILSKIWNKAVEAKLEAFKVMYTWAALHYPPLPLPPDPFLKKKKKSQKTTPKKLKKTAQKNKGSSQDENCLQYFHIIQCNEI